MKGFECSIDFPKPIGRKKMEKATAVLGNWMFLPKTAAGKGGTVEFNMTDLDKKKELKGDRKRNGEYMKASYFLDMSAVKSLKTVFQYSISRYLL